MSDPVFEAPFPQRKTGMDVTVLCGLCSDPFMCPTTKNSTEPIPDEESMEKLKNFCFHVGKNYNSLKNVSTFCTKCEKNIQYCWDFQQNIEKATAGIQVIKNHYCSGPVPFVMDQNPTSLISIGNAFNSNLERETLGETDNINGTVENNERVVVPDEQNFLNRSPPTAVVAPRRKPEGDLSTGVIVAVQNQGRNATPINQGRTTFQRTTETNLATVRRGGPPPPYFLPGGKCSRCIRKIYGNERDLAAHLRTHEVIEGHVDDIITSVIAAGSITGNPSSD